MRLRCKHGRAGMGVCLLVGHPDSTAALNTLLYCSDPTSTDVEVFLLVGHPDSTTALNTLLYCTDPTSTGVEVFLLVGFLVLVIILPINCVGDEVDNLVASVSAPTRSRCL